MKKRLLFTLMVILMGLQAVMAQTGSIRGKITDDKGDPIPGATIRVKGTNKGTVSDMNGNFRLNTEDGTALTISAIGMKTTEKSAQDGMSVKLVTDQQSLRETVVTALAIKREKASLGYATTTLNSNDINNGNNVSALSSLAGKVSGANVTSTTGGIGGSTRIILRGEKSIGQGSSNASNNALIVVDGIPVNNNSRVNATDFRGGSLGQMDFGNRGNDVNPDDIESISVLKGAAATALYGSQGANGAIMITTKSGKVRAKVSKNEVSYTTGYSWSDVLMFPEFQNTYGQGDLHGVFDDRRENFSWGKPFDGELRPWGQVINGKQKVKKYEAQGDNVKDFFNKGKAWENNLALSGGTEFSNYFLSFNTINGTGITPNTFTDRYSIRLNANHQFSNNFFSNVNVNYVKGHSKLDQSGQEEGSVWDNLLQTPRDIPIPDLADLDDPFNSMDYLDTADGIRKYGYYGDYADNPYWVAKNFDNRNRFDRVLGQTTVGYHLGNNITLSNRFGGEALSDRISMKTPKLETIAFEHDAVGPRGDAWGQDRNYHGSFFESNFNFASYFNDIMLAANYQIAKLGINALVGHSVVSERRTYLSSDIDPNTNGLVIEDFYNFGNAKSPIKATNTLTKNSKVGVYGTFNFDFDKIFFLELTGRNDWSSTLPQENRSYFYPAISASWLFSQHLSEAGKKVLSYGKLRGNISSVGNDAAAYVMNDPGFVSTDVTSGFGTNTFPFNGVPGFSLQNRIGFPNLKPERTVGKEIGIDLAFLDDRITLDFTLYKSKTKDQIIIVDVAPSSGFSGKLINAGTIENKGVELGMKVSPIKRKGLRWDIYGTYSRNKNVVLDLPGGVDHIVLGGFSGMSIVAAVGKPFGTFYSLDYLKDDKGRQVIDTLTGAPRSTTTPVYLGSYQPRFMASWGTSLTFKGLSMNVLFDTKQGGYFYSRTKDIMEFVGTSVSSTLNDRQPFIWENSVIENAEGDYVANTSIQTDPYLFFTTNGHKPPSDELVKSGYVKLREVSLGYKLPQKWFKNTFIGSGNVSIFGNNLKIWTNKQNKYADPEVNSGGAGNVQGFDFSARPSQRNYGFKVGLTF